MVIWDKTITMADKLREYDKETLKRFGSDMGLKGLSKRTKWQADCKRKENLSE